MGEGALLLEALEVLEALDFLEVLDFLGERPLPVPTPLVGEVLSSSSQKSLPVQREGIYISPMSGGEGRPCCLSMSPVCGAAFAHVAAR